MQAMTGSPLKAPEMAPREPQVNSAMVRLQTALQLLEEVASTVEQRLSVVLVSTPPEQQGKGVSAVCVPLAENLNGYADRIACVNNALTSVLQRLEL